MEDPRSVVYCSEFADIKKDNGTTREHWSTCVDDQGGKLALARVLRLELVKEC